MDGAAQHFEEEWQRLYTNAGRPGPDTLPPGPARESIRAWERDGRPPRSPEYATAAFHFLRSAARKLGCPEEELPTVERLFGLWREAVGAAGDGDPPRATGRRGTGYGAPPPLFGAAPANAPAPAAPGAPAPVPPTPPPLGSGGHSNTITGPSQQHGPVIQGGDGMMVTIHPPPSVPAPAPVPPSGPPEPQEPPDAPQEQPSDPPDATPVLQVQDGSMKLTFFNDRVAEMWITVRWGSQQ